MRFLLLMGLPLVAAAGLPATPPGATVSFQIIDETDPQEISEDTVVFIDGHQVAHFVLDKSQTSAGADVTLPTAARYDYALCGRITIWRPDGQAEEHVVDGGATLTEVNGKLFRALAANDFSIFYLADAKQEVQDPPKDVRHTNACSLPVS